MELPIIRQSVGIDVAMDDFKVCYGYLNVKMERKIVSESTFENTASGMESLMLWLAQHILSEDELYFLMESTGVYHEQLCHFIHDHGFNVSVMPSGRVKKYSESLKQRSKTDLFGRQDAMFFSPRKRIGSMVSRTPRTTRVETVIARKGSISEGTEWIEMQVSRFTTWNQDTRECHFKAEKSSQVAFRADSRSRVRNAIFSDFGSRTKAKDSSTHYYSRR